jgi:hypothetical protein
MSDATYDRWPELLSRLDPERYEALTVTLAALLNGWLTAAALIGFVDPDEDGRPALRAVADGETARVVSLDSRYDRN